MLAVRDDDQARPSEPLSRRLVRLVAWVATATLGTVAVSQALGGTWLAPLFVLQALTPYLLVAGVALLVVAFRLRAVVMALLLVATVVGLGSVVASAFDRPDMPAADPIAAPLRIAHANVYFDNDRNDRAAFDLLAIDADMLAVSEYSYGIADELIRQGIADIYPYRAVHDADDRNGIALFSRLPLLDTLVAPIGTQMGIVATVELNGEPVRVVVAHPVPGDDQGDVDDWADDLRALTRLVDSSDATTVVVGDLNATRWHPVYRDLLATGLTDAHTALGRTWSMSWPTGRLVPPFVRIDHALLSPELVPLHIDDVDVTGSDHRGFVVTVAPAAPAMP